MLAGAPPARLHLVGDEKDAVLVEDLFQSGEEPVGWYDEAAHPLDGLGDQAGDVPRGGRLDDLAQVGGAGGIELVVTEPGERPSPAVPIVEVAHLQRAQARSRPAPVPGDRHGRERPPVIAVAQGQHLVGPPGAAAQQEGGLGGLGARAHEEDLGIGDGRQRRYLLGQLDHGADEVQGRGVQDAARLLPDRLHHFRHGVAGHRGQDATEEVEVVPALGVGDHATLAGDKLQRFVVIEGEPRRQDLAVAFEQLRRAHSGPTLVPP